jgi:3-deoxy-D-manno-octulosonate 8-phosphate phosphatase (KDO 8-P phosphatase)
MEGAARRKLVDGLQVRLRSARLVALDVDGVLTDGRVIHSPTGELQVFDVRDGLGIKLLLREGLTVAWISGRGCAATKLRAAELGVSELHLHSGPKGEVLAALQARLGVRPEETIAMGDDLPDLGLASRAGLFAAPADAHPEVLARAHYVCAAPGGRGAVRELAEILLRARGAWQRALDDHAR